MASFMSSNSVVRGRENALVNHKSLILLPPKLHQSINIPHRNADIHRVKQNHSFQSLIRLIFLLPQRISPIDIHQSTVLLDDDVFLEARQGHVLVLFVSTVEVSRRVA
jgi:hypothetical protein